MSDEERGTTPPESGTLNRLGLEEAGPDDLPVDDLLAEALSEEAPTEPASQETQPQQPAPATPAPAPAPAPQPEVQPAPAPVQPQITPPAEPGQPTTPTEQQQPAETVTDRFSKFRDPQGNIDVDRVLSSYENVETWNHRVSQENGDLRQRNTALQTENEQMRAAAQQIIEHLRRAPQVQQEPEIDFEDPAQRQQYIQAEAQRQAQAIIQQQLAQTQAFQQQQQPQPTPAPQEQVEHDTAVAVFAQQHPEAVRDPEMDSAMTRVIRMLRYDRDEGVELEENFPITAENLEVAYTLAREPVVEQLANRLNFVPSDDADIQLLREAASAPALAQVLEANPGYLRSVAGHNLARQTAAMFGGYTQVQQGAQDALQQAAQRDRARAHVETGPGGAPVQGAPGERKNPDDYDFSDVLELDRQRRGSRF